MIIHSPVISGSLTFADGATFTLPDNGIYSGSFSGSFQGDGSSLTFGGTNIISSSNQLAADFLDTLGDGVISGSDQLTQSLDLRYLEINGDGVVSGSSQISYNGITDKPSIISGSIQVEFNEITNNPFSQSGPSVFVDSNIIPTSLNLDLGSPSAPFKDLYLSSASLYVDGTQVISSNTNELIITTDANQSLKLVETGADTIQLQTENGDITLTTSGTGNIELDAPIQIAAGNQILSSDGNAIQFGEDINVQGNITLTGTVDGVDVASLNTDFGTLKGKTLVSSSVQISAYNKFLEINGDSVVSGSSQVVLESADKTGFTGASSITTLGTISSGVWQGSIIDSQYLDADPLPVGTISGSSQVDLTQTTNYVSGIKTRLNAEGVISGSSQVTGYVPTNSAQALSSADNALTFAANTLTLTRGDGTTDTVNLSAYLDDTNLARVISGTYDSNAQELVFTRDDATTFSIDASMFFDDTNLVTSVNGDTGAVTLVTDDIAEDGSPTNLWFTTARARGAFSSGTGVSISSGEISIGQAVATNSTVQFAKVGVGGASDSTYELKVTGDIGATGDVVAYVSSDERLKKNIELISNPIQKVQALKGVTWVWKDEASDAAKASPNLGVIAQDVEKVLPQLVHDRENGYKGVDYAKMVGLLIEAIKDQQKQIDDLKSRLQ